ncbi:MAG: hypothetical protein ACD_79C00438G0004 [uncultured bacterium]|nr:MAG: hypothetical protein ACD_79C00438G0004 [uncultured bacterium]
MINKKKIFILIIFVFGFSISIKSKNTMQLESLPDNYTYHAGLEIPKDKVEQIIWSVEVTGPKEFVTSSLWTKDATNSAPFVIQNQNLRESTNDDGIKININKDNPFDVNVVVDKSIKGDGILYCEWDSSNGLFNATPKHLFSRYFSELKEIQISEFQNQPLLSSQKYSLIKLVGVYKDSTKTKLYISDLENLKIKSSDPNVATVKYMDTPFNNLVISTHNTGKTLINVSYKGFECFFPINIVNPMGLTDEDYERFNYVKNIVDNLKVYKINKFKNISLSMDENTGSYISVYGHVLSKEDLNALEVLIRAKIPDYKIKWNVSYIVAIAAYDNFNEPLKPGSIKTTKIRALGNKGDGFYLTPEWGTPSIEVNNSEIVKTSNINDEGSFTLETLKLGTTDITIKFLKFENTFNVRVENPYGFTTEEYNKYLDTEAHAELHQQLLKQDTRYKDVKIYFSKNKDYKYYINGSVSSEEILSELQRYFSAHPPPIEPQFKVIVTEVKEYAELCSNELKKDSRFQNINLFTTSESEKKYVLFISGVVDNDNNLNALKEIIKAKDFKATLKWDVKVQAPISKIKTFNRSNTSLTVGDKYIKEIALYGINSEGKSIDPKDMPYDPFLSFVSLDPNIVIVSEINKKEKYAKIIPKQRGITEIKTIYKNLECTIPIYVGVPLGLKKEFLNQYINSSDLSEKINPIFLSNTKFKNITVKPDITTGELICSGLLLSKNDYEPLVNLIKSYIPDAIIKYQINTIKGIKVISRMDNQDDIINIMLNMSQIPIMLGFVCDEDHVIPSEFSNVEIKSKVENPDILEIINENGSCFLLIGKKIGKTKITFSYDNLETTMTVNVFVQEQMSSERFMEYEKESQLFLKKVEDLLKEKDCLKYFQPLCTFNYEAFGYYGYVFNASLREELINLVNTMNPPKNFSFGVNLIKKLKISNLPDSSLNPGTQYTLQISLLDEKDRIYNIHFEDKETIRLSNSNPNLFTANYDSQGDTVIIKTLTPGEAELKISYKTFEEVLFIKINDFKSPNEKNIDANTAAKRFIIKMESILSNDPRFKFIKFYIRNNDNNLYIGGYITNKNDISDLNRILNEQNPPVPLIYSVSNLSKIESICKIQFPWTVGAEIPIFFDLRADNEEIFHFPECDLLVIENSNPEILETPNSTNNNKIIVKAVGKGNGKLKFSYKDLSVVMSYSIIYPHNMSEKEYQQYQIIKKHAENTTPDLHKIPKFQNVNLEADYSLTKSIYSVSGKVATEEDYVELIKFLERTNPIPPVIYTIRTKKDADYNDY